MWQHEFHRGPKGALPLLSQDEAVSCTPMLAKTSKAIRPLRSWFVLMSQCSMFNVSQCWPWENDLTAVPVSIRGDGIWNWVTFLFISFMPALALKNINAVILLTLRMRIMWCYHTPHAMTLTGYSSFTKKVLLWPMLFLTCENVMISFSFIRISLIQPIIYTGLTIDLSYVASCCYYLTIDPTH